MDYNTTTNVPRDWTDSTPFETHFDVARAIRIVNVYGTKGVDGVYTYLKSDDQFVRGMLPQYKRAQGYKCVGVLGFCHKLDEIVDLDNPTNRTTQIVAGFEQAGYKVILWDMRKECQQKSCAGECEVQCKELKDSGLRALYCLATALAFAVARRHYNIELVSTISFSACCNDQLLCLLEDR